MNKNARIFVAGHRGLVGSALVRQLQQEGYGHILLRTRAELDLRDQPAVERFFAAEKPEYVFLAAAKVGGIHANSAYPADFIYDNLAIQTNVIHAAHTHGVKRLLFPGSSCIYPKLAAQPMQESCLLTGPLEPSNQPYAVAKIAGIEMCRGYNRQYGTRFLAVMPTNLYGPGDNYHPENSHVIPALVRKFCTAAARGDAEVVVWGTGAARREFMHSGDMASACVFLMNLPDARFDALLGGAPLLNVGVGRDISIRELAELLKTIAGFAGAIRYDQAKPDGTPQKLLDVSKMEALGWKARVALADGLKQVVAEFAGTLGKA